MLLIKSNVTGIGPAGPINGGDTTLVVMTDTILKFGKELDLAIR